MGNSIGNTYSFKDLVGNLVNPVFGVSLILAGGYVGVGSITIRMSNDRTSHDRGADGTIMPSYEAGNNGDFDIEVQQTSSLHHELLALYNLAQTAADNDDLAGWAATQVSFQTILDGSTHNLTGVSFKKIPDKPYQVTGQKVTWTLMAANVVQM